MKNKILSVLVENNYGVVARIAGLFTRRGFNLNSFTGEETDDPNVSRITISVTQKEDEIYQIRKQVEKLVDIKKVIQLDPKDSVVKELALIKINLNDQTSDKAMYWVEEFSARLVDIDTKVMTFQICNNKEKIDQFMEAVRPYGIIESVRTGVVALARG
ncbi:MAG TPA: acetolactate synthase small subunit, partial [Epulopiscium sp.]|nr:acetolactate synthase small subunit [Candidatus Epulonipiscium sp.]